MNTKYLTLALLAALACPVHADWDDDDKVNDEPEIRSYWNHDATEEYYKWRARYGLDSAPVVVVPAAPGLSSNPSSGTTYLPGGGMCFQTGRSVNCY